MTRTPKSEFFEVITNCVSRTFCNTTFKVLSDDEFYLGMREIVMATQLTSQPDEKNT